MALHITVYFFIKLEKVKLFKINVTLEAQHIYNEVLKAKYSVDVRSNLSSHISRSNYLKLLDSERRGPERVVDKL